MTFKTMILPNTTAKTLFIVMMTLSSTWATIQEMEPLASWTSAGIDYVWDDTNVREEFLTSGAFQPNNNNMAGIKIKPGATPEETVVFLSVPRWFPGVPSTLNKITLDLTDGTAPINLPLEPYPSWEAQAIGGDCSGLQYVQSMEIDNEGLMWVIDTGRINIFTGEPDNTCPPKLVIIDTATGEFVDEPYIFPDIVASHTSTHLNDLVIDNKRQIAYITDSADAALITYDRANRRAQRFTSPTMFPDGMGGAPDLSVVWSINGVDLPNTWPGAGVPMDGIALTPDGSRVYYTTLGGRNVYSLDAAAASTFGHDIMSEAEQAEYSAMVEATIVDHGGKVDATDGMAFTCDGELIYGALNGASVYSWTATADDSSDPFTSSSVVATNEDLMHWQDTFAFDGSDDSLWFTANFLHELFTFGVAGPAYLFKIPTAGSYQKGDCSSAPSPPTRCDTSDISFVLWNVDTNTTIGDIEVDLNGRIDLCDYNGAALSIQGIVPDCTKWLRFNLLNEYNRLVVRRTEGNQPLMLGGDIDGPPLRILPVDALQVAGSYTLVYNPRPGPKDFITFEITECMA